jgi:hypothetical protein
MLGQLERTRKTEQNAIGTATIKKQKTHKRYLVHSPTYANSYVPEGPAQVETQYTRGQLYTYVSTGESGLNPNSNTLEPDIAQQYSSRSLPQEKLGPFQKCYLILSLLFLKLCKSETALT